MRPLVSRDQGPRRRAVGEPRRALTLQAGIGHAESLIYLVVGVLLVVAAGFTLVGTVVDVIRGSGSRQVTDTGVFLLERVLLVFIIAELLYTLRLVDFGGRILVEPFLFIGLIAVVRRILVITAEIEGGSNRQITNWLIEIGALGGLAFALALSIHLLRRSAAGPPAEAALEPTAAPEPGRAPPTRP
ncbi:MAG: hypothetical protein QOD44_1506 [Solirubrobacteraceae bacterium]|jgi:uncharacterized membrane protein (DUF373 family)|nr:hypothetical protein [Solirubrobacteraceae bacterium]